MRKYRTQIRIPGDLADWIKERACEEHRSMNAQIVHYLETQRQQEQKNEEAGTKK
ncbi:Arc family DNA-binding protein [Halomonas sp. ATCH28]|uniref:Arc family DNA-binding protein n=1 Tax=Halomonas gemina TaxID=2945105 RepID=A0ABT0T3C6_9GAMM|nr:Arc family DNA-binding protein [Halomonas gemina]MCL7941234.1 Arc family DNA-binding protein [Halomonas gemina]